MNAFVDTNVLLDVLGNRDPFYADSAAVWSLAEQGKITGLIAAVSFTNIFYMIRRWSGLGAASKAMILLRDSFTTVTCDALVVNQAIDADIPDFEDAVQCFGALHAGADCILTRDVGGFPPAPAGVGALPRGVPGRL
ncbi:MAG: PIN domain-containing protein [Planctomycetes bacterium]|nr:PIN domain-containing protein [Planctomycetota bacterium]